MNMSRKLALNLAGSYKNKNSKPPLYQYPDAERSRERTGIKLLRTNKTHTMLWQYLISAIEIQSGAL